MAIVVKFSKKEGVELATENKLCRDNIKVELDAEGQAALVPENIRNGTKILGVEGTYETDLTAELADQDELLTEIEVLLGTEVGGGDDGGDSGDDSGSSSDSATLTVNLAEEYEEWDEETDETWMEYEPTAYSGTYSVDGGDEISFSSTSQLVIEGLAVGSVVRLQITGGAWMSNNYGTTNAVGCTGDYRCEEEGHEPWEDEYYDDYCGEYGCQVGAVITITASTASITVYECYC